VESSFRDNRLTVVLPAQLATQWATDETAVSVAGEHGPASVLVEKDFECLDPRTGEDQSNRFRSPKADEVFHFVQQDRSAWSFYAEVRPFHEVW
jgi:hypothetical protein